ncbi:MAG: lasso peptide biosynthesis B2 protein [Spirochaetales bacterium]|nr:lasso peptide biosynthesis B2 protein [Spirochaetales bacterium]
MKKYLKRFRTVRAMSREEKKIYRRALRLLVNVRLRMVFTSFPKVLAWVRKQSPVVASVTCLNPDRLSWMINSTGIAFPRIFKCLPRALAGFIVLRRCGWEVTLKIGARRRHPSLPMEAHAWLEREGTVIMGDLFGLEKFAVFESFEGEYL